MYTPSSFSLINITDYSSQLSFGVSSPLMKQSIITTHNKLTIFMFILPNHFKGQENYYTPVWLWRYIIIWLTAWIIIALKENTNETLKSLSWWMIFSLPWYIITNYSWSEISSSYFVIPCFIYFIPLMFVNIFIFPTTYALITDNEPTQFT